MKIHSYKDLTVWQKAVDISLKIYKITKRFPQNEIYGITSQMRRCAISIPSNIAEGNMRGHKTEYVQFLRIAYSSSGELETQLLIAHRIGYLSEKDYTAINNYLDEIQRMLNKLISNLLVPNP